ncbi:hypothetical protein CBL_10575 [Carabus blaptoides fortunei]
MSLEDFFETIKLVLVDALTQVASVFLLICIPKEKLTECVNQGSDSLADAMFFKKEELSLDAYRKYPAYKKVVDESLSDLRDAMYNAGHNDDQTLVMEDIYLKGYRLPERQTVFDLDKLHCMLKSLAMYHAAGFAYERTKSKELNKPFCLGEEYYDVLEEVFFTQYRGMKGHLLDWWKTSFDTMDKLIDELPKDEEYKKVFKKLLKNSTVGRSISNVTSSREIHSSTK